MIGLAAAQRSYERWLPVDCAAPEAPDPAFWNTELRRMVMTEENFPGCAEKAAEYIGNDIPGRMTEAQAVSLLRAALTGDDVAILVIVKKLANDAIALNAESIEIE